MSLVNELDKLKDIEIAVVMNDGQAYRGMLEAFDEETIIIVKILETSNVDVDWVESKGKKDKPSKIKGYMHWRRITLPKLIIRTQLVLRVWPWLPKKV